MRNDIHQNVTGRHHAQPRQEAIVTTADDETIPTVPSTTAPTPQRAASSPEEQKTQADVPQAAEQPVQNPNDHCEPSQTGELTCFLDGAPYKGCKPLPNGDVDCMQAVPVQ